MQKLTYKRDTTFPLKIKVYDFGKPARFTTGQFDIFVKSMIPTSDQIQINISNEKFLIGQETSLVTKCEISKGARISPTLISNPPELARGFKISETCELSVTNYNFIRNGSLTITAVSGNGQSKGRSQKNILLSYAIIFGVVKYFLDSFKYLTLKILKRGSVIAEDIRNQCDEEFLPSPISIIENSVRFSN